LSLRVPVRVEAGAPRSQVVGDDPPQIPAATGDIGTPRLVSTRSWSRSATRRSAPRPSGAASSATRPR